MLGVFLAHMAAEKGLSAAVICCLLKAGADATIVDFLGLNAAATAAQHGHATTAALLQRAAADQRSRQQQQQQRQQQQQLPAADVTADVPLEASPAVHGTVNDAAVAVPAVLSAADLIDEDLPEGSWLSDSDTALRVGVLARVFKMMIEFSSDSSLAAAAAGMPSSSAQRYTLKCARGIEHALYSRSESLEAFADTSTLNARLLQACSQMQVDVQTAAAAAAAAGAEAALPWRCAERDAPARALTTAKVQRQLQQHSSLLPQPLWEVAVPALAQHIEKAGYGTAASLEQYSDWTARAHVAGLSAETIANLQRTAAMRAAVEHYELLPEYSDSEGSSSDAAGLGAAAESGSSDVQQQQQQQRQQAAVAVVAPAVLAAVAAGPLAAPAAPAEAAAAALAGRQAAEQWKLVQSEAPLRQLTLAKARAVLRRNRPPWLSARFWAAAVPALAKQLEAIVYESTTDAHMYSACSLNEQLLEHSFMMIHTLQSDANVRTAAAQDELPEQSDDETADTEADSTEHTAAADSAAAESAKAGAVAIADLVTRSLQQHQPQQCEQADSTTDKQACAAVESTVAAAVVEAAAVADARCTQQTACTKQTADDNEQQQQQVVAVTLSSVAAERCSIATLRSDAVKVAASEVLNTADTSDAPCEPLSATVTMCTAAEVPAAAAAAAAAEVANVADTSSSSSAGDSFGQQHQQCQPSPISAAEQRAEATAAHALAAAAAVTAAVNRVAELVQHEADVHTLAAAVTVATVAAATASEAATAQAAAWQQFNSVLQAQLELLRAVETCDDTHHSALVHDDTTAVHAAGTAAVCNNINNNNSSESSSSSSSSNSSSSVSSGSNSTISREEITACASSKSQRERQPCTQCSVLTKKRCRRCQVVYYCSVECQIECFKDPEHRAQCEAAAVVAVDVIN
jgi:trimeric autotransporter adhesin